MRIPSRYLRILWRWVVISALVLTLLPTPSVGAGYTAAIPTSDPLRSTSINTEPIPSPLHNGKDRVDIRVTQSSLRGFAAEFHFPRPHLWTVYGPDKLKFTEMGVPGIEQASLAPGQPHVPLYSRLLAVPKGAKASAKVGQIDRESVRVLNDILLYPVQYEAADIAMSQNKDDEFPIDDFRDPPFIMDKEAYASRESFPRNLVEVEHVGTMRGLDLVRVSVATAQYTPSKQELVVFQSVPVQIHFEGGEEHFLTSRDLDPFNHQHAGFYELVLNAEILEKFVLDVPFRPFLCIGTEYLIITDPLFRSAADDLRDWKVTKGISTSVVETGNGPGQAGVTREQIRDYIQDRYDRCWVRPSYVLLLGDAEHIAPFYRPITWNIGTDMAATDLDYTLMDGNDIMPDLAIGRIPVDTLAQAQVVIDKTIRYERNPPFNRDFYRNVSLAAYFQCCRADVAQDGTASRSFIETAELVRGELLNQGYTVTRIYNTSDKYHDDPNQSGFYDASVRSTVPNRYYNTALLPADLRASSGFAWDGNTDDVIDAFNDGNFLILHRDHGSINGWGDPRFRIADLGGLNNGRLTPVVYSINCASGLFDNETRNPANDVFTYNTTVNGVYWAESLLRMEGGAVAIIGDTRNSPTWANSALTRGLMDATWPNTVPEGGNTPIRRLGDILNYGKSYLVGQVGVAQTAGSVSTNTANMNVIMYHVFGDPTLEMWTSMPWHVILPGLLIPVEFHRNFTLVRYQVDGATITALQDGLPVGRGVVQNGVARLDFLEDLKSREGLTFSASLPGAVSVPLKMERYSGEVDPNKGGTVRNERGSFEIEFPPRAVDRPVEVIYTNLFTPTQALPEGFDFFHSFEMRAEDADGKRYRHFAQPYTMQVCLNRDDAKPQSEPILGFFDEDAMKWVPVDSKWDGQCAVAQLDHFTEFALLADDPNALGGGDTTYQLYLPGVQR